jgi:hypothetical protein
MCRWRSSTVCADCPGSLLPRHGSKLVEFRVTQCCALRSRHSPFDAGRERRLIAPAKIGRPIIAAHPHQAPSVAVPSIRRTSMAFRRSPVRSRSGPPNKSASYGATSVAPFFSIATILQRGNPSGNRCSAFRYVPSRRGRERRASSLRSARSRENFKGITAPLLASRGACAIAECVR